MEANLSRPQSVKASPACGDELKQNPAVFGL